MFYVDVYYIEILQPIFCGNMNDLYSSLICAGCIASEEIGGWDFGLVLLSNPLDTGAEWHWFLW